MLRSLLAALALCGATLGPLAATAADAQPPASGTSMGAIQSANIFDVKPDASQDPGYAEQTNAQRTQVQPGNNAPNWRLVNSGEPGYSSLPRSQAPEAGVLIQRFVQYPGSAYTTAGEAWRQVRNDWLIPYGGSLLLIVLVAIALFYFAKGPITVHGAETGRRIERFTYFERAAHWTNAVAFVVLAISGLVMAFGKFFLLPVMGSALFGWMTWALKTLHNFVGPLFAVSLLVVFFTFIRDNLPSRDDIVWLRKGGGLFNNQHVPSGRFNAGEKLVFWGGVMFLGFIVIGSGLVLDRVIPGLVYTRGTMQIAHMVHAVATILMMCMFLGHIYLGTIGMRGAYKAMKTGYVDETWAREHHELWYNDIQAGKIPAERTRPAGKKPDTRPANA
ncbi:MAG: formate dehydrogenase subunit gamma [Pigmentiphaga sp.]|uniref:formate dehydrogenase subunit gamma n=1 Tax=Pigmentiphaga sp. TaxID=1977564 RepID=UPI0029A42A79|nr:formate dehydrogenase subunit gamma [Pigmentiphaga sp.]MDX3906529.1 formate dehydrogenase subunit gamma [Pigmentiphaga sp.]